MNKKILVVAAHPDDEVLGCGGTVARLAKQGSEIEIAILGEGITSRYDQRGLADEAQITELKGCSDRVAAFLGAKKLHQFGLPDNRFDSLDLLDIVKKVENLVMDLRPEAIFTHHPGDLNIDHALTFRAVMTATRPTANCAVKEIYTFEVPSSTEWAFGRFETPFRPNVFLDISGTIEAKADAMSMYPGEQRDFPHPRSAQALRVLAQRWGSTAGLNHAEAFELIRSVR